jgi:beta-glucoside kinase
MKRYISFDVGGTSVKYGVMDENGAFLEKGDFATNRNSGQEILAQMLRTIERHGPLAGVAISIPGLVNYRTGVIRVGGAIPDFDKLNIKAYFEERTQLPTSVENDANCVALAEKWLGNAQQESDFLCVTIGSGIGGACFLNGRLYRGATFAAGEFGYMITQGLHNNVANNCVLNRTATILVMRRHYAEFKRLPLEQVSGEMVFDEAKNGDPYARHAVNQLLDALSIGLHNLFFILDPAKILLGGAVSRREDLIPELKWRIQRLNNFGIEVPLERCRFYNDSGMIGALYHHLTEYGGRGEAQ